MGLRNEYSYDAFVGEDVIEEQDEDEGEEPLDPESWEIWYSDHLLNMWMSLRTYLEDNSINNSVMQKATYNDFLQFVHDFS